MNGPILIQMAMHAEADPAASRLGLADAGALHPNLPARMFHSGAAPIVLVVHGVDERFGVDAIGTQPAAVTAFAACERLRPRLIINAGTAGGFASAGARIGDIYVSDGPVRYHSRRIELGAFGPYGVGSYPSLDMTAIASRLGLKRGRLTSGDALDLCDADARTIAASGARIKDMEAAAVAWVATLVGVPFVGLKAITDLVDVGHATTAQFTANLDLAVERLTEKLVLLVEALAKP